jgi:hypothetical protein
MQTDAKPQITDDWLKAVNQLSEIMELRFPELNGGPVKGLNDAGVENFQGAIDHYLSRECGQNTADAPGDGVGTVRLEFSKLSMQPSDIPGFEQLRQTLDACLERWRDKKKEKEFFDSAIAMANRDEIPVLRIADFGTTGLTGDDTDEGGRWVPLVKSEGLSNKGDTAGGSFGIGKSSPFAASRFRTVFYGTRTEAGDVALQGVTRLVTHKNPEGKLTQGVGYCGDFDSSGGEGGGPVFRAIRDEAEIPEKFRRAKPGTDIWVIGYRSGPEWKEGLIRSILSNFWPAIHFGRIEFKVGDVLIDKESLPELIQRRSHEDEFEAHHFYKALINRPATKTLPQVGSCELYLTTTDAGLPRRICMVRNNGMRIYDYAPRSCRVPFSGLFICTDEEGNKLLRDMEPPRHDKWDPQRVEGNRGINALSEIKIWIRDEVKKLNPLFSGNSFNENELAKYLSEDDPKDENDLPNEDVGSSEEKDLDPKPKPEELPVKALVVRPVTVQPTSTGGGDGPGRDGGDGAGGAGGGAGGTGDGGPRLDEVDLPPDLQVRTFSSGGVNGYRLVLRSETDFDGAVGIFAVGEDGSREPVSVRSARHEGSGKPLAASGATIKGIKLSANTPLRIELEIDALNRRSLTAIAKK